MDGYIDAKAAQPETDGHVALVYDGANMSKRKFCGMIAKENEAFPPKEREGWSSTNPDDIKSLINRELRELRAQEEPPRLSVIEGGKGTKTP